MIAASWILDESIDDPILECVHDERENKHHEGNLDCLIPFCPTKCPVAYPCDPREELEDEENAEFHAEEAEEVDYGLLQPPHSAWWVAIITRPDRLWGVGEGCKESTLIQKLEEQD